jgi:hypothetical protein
MQNENASLERGWRFRNWKFKGKRAASNHEPAKLKSLGVERAYDSVTG